MIAVPHEMLISVVDDDESVRAGTASLLRSAGYAVETYASAEAFLDAADRRRYACVVADIHMPGMSGIELTERLEQDARRVPVILMTGRTDPDVLARAAASSASCVLSKPFAAEHLLQCLERATR